MCSIVPPDFRTLPLLFLPAKPTLEIGAVQGKSALNSFLLNERNLFKMEFTEQRHVALLR